MTLWAVEVTSAENGVRTSFPAMSRESAVESAGRINDWIHRVRRDHVNETTELKGVSADVIPWAGTDEEHRRQLSIIVAQMEEEYEEV